MLEREFRDIDLPISEGKSEYLTVTAGQGEQCFRTVVIED